MFVLQSSENGSALPAVEEAPVVEASPAAVAPVVESPPVAVPVVEEAKSDAQPEVQEKVSDESTPALPSEPEPVADVVPSEPVIEKIIESSIDLVNEVVKELDNKEAAEVATVPSENAAEPEPLPEPVVEAAVVESKQEEQQSAPVESEVVEKVPEVTAVEAPVEPETPEVPVESVPAVVEETPVTEPVVESEIKEEEASIPSEPEPVNDNALPQDGDQLISLTNGNHEQVAAAEETTATNGEQPSEDKSDAVEVAATVNEEETKENVDDQSATEVKQTASQDDDAQTSLSILSNDNSNQVVTDSTVSTTDSAETASEQQQEQRQEEQPEQQPEQEQKPEQQPEEQQLDQPLPPVTNEQTVNVESQLQTVVEDNQIENTPKEEVTIPVVESEVPSKPENITIEQDDTKIIAESKLDAEIEAVIPPAIESEPVVNDEKVEPETVTKQIVKPVTGDEVPSVNGNGLSNGDEKHENGIEVAPIQQTPGEIVSIWTFSSRQSFHHHVTPTQLLVFNCMFYCNQSYPILWIISILSDYLLLHVACIWLIPLCFRFCSKYNRSFNFPLTN